MTVSATGNSSDSIPSLTQAAALEAVLFDVDGTLCDSDPIHYYAFRELLPETGFNGGVPITEEFYVQNFAGKHNDDVAAILFPDDIERGLKFCEDKEAMFRRLLTIFLYTILQLLTLCPPLGIVQFPPVLDVLLVGKYRLAKEQLKAVDGLYKLRKWIEDRGLRRVAVTNAPKPNAELMISLLGLSDFFEAVILGSDCTRAKPFPDPYLKALEILQVSKDHSIIFEDSFSGITAGVAAGMPVVGLTTRNPENLLMQAKPALLIKNYEDPKLWAALEEFDKRAGRSTDTAFANK
nr:haloacid dehalogenase-like hydrolase domain-containing protein Sgpp isoform X1 [Coffea arabica]